MGHSILCRWSFHLVTPPVLVDRAPRRTPSTMGVPACEAAARRSADQARVRVAQMRRGSNP